MAIGKPFRSGGFSEEEYLQLAKVFGGKPADMIKDIVRGFIGKIVSRYYDDHSDMAEYLCGGAEDIAVRIDVAVQCGNVYLW